MVTDSPDLFIRHWNIFARELEAILAKRGLRLSHLDDRGVVFHREKVRRLQQSLKSPRHLTTLNPHEIERLVAIMQLTELEQRRLQAALLATAVEMTLMDRIDSQTALMASDDVFHILFAAMKAQPDGVMTTGVKAGALTDDPDTFGDSAFSQALDLIDRALLAIHMSRNASSHQAQINNAQEAFDTFSRSLVLLQQCQMPLPESNNWRYWHDEATNGQKMAKELLLTKEA